MKTKRTRWWLKSAALLCATVFGLTAFGGIHEWTPVEGGTTYWDDEANWAIGSEDWTDYRIGNNGAQITFRSAVSADDVDAVLVYNGEHTLVAEDASFGLSKPNAPLNFEAPWWYTGNPVLNITSGTYQFGSINLASNADYGGSATLNLNGGTLTASDVTVGADCTIVLNGGTLSATTVGGAGTLAIGANGGTFANAEAATISSAITGSGTLTKTGAGDLTISGDVTGFTGKIAVAAEAGYVTITALGVTVNEGEEFQFGAYYWTGAGTKTTTVDPDSGDEVQTVANTDVWANLDNWLVNGKVPTALPTATSTVIIPAGDGSALTIKCAGASDYTGYLTINRNVEFVRESNAQYKGITLTQVNGTGTLKISGNIRGSGAIYDQDYFNIYPSTESTFEINCALDTHGRIRLERVRESSTSKWSKVLNVKGALTGDGRIVCDDDTNSVQGMNFSGDTSAFAGTYEGASRAGWTRDATKFSGDARGSAAASWTFGRWEGNASQAGYTPFLVNNVTYQFGQLTAPLMHFWRGYTGSNTTGATIEVGALADKTSTVVGSLSPNGNTLRKVGATSTLKYTNSGTIGGTVEAYEGTTVIEGTATGFTLKFSGPDATIKIARSTTTETTVEPEEEGGEATTTTTTTANIPATFVPGFTDALAGCQYEVAQETVDNVTYDVYTVLKDVATDSAGTTYDSVALALAAIAADETGTLTKAITLAKSTTEAVTLPLGYSLALNGKTVGSVAGAAGVGVAYDEATDTWTTVDNTAAIWKGDAAGANWADAANWSTGYVPDESTAVTFNYSALVYLSEYAGPTHKCATLKLKDGVTVEFAPTGRNQNLYPRIAVYGENVWGDATLKLYRCGLYNAHGSAIKIFPNVMFENQGIGYDSYVENGSFTFARRVSGTGMFVCYNACQFNAGITVEGDSLVDCRVTPTFAENATLVGDGTLVCTGSMPGTRLAEALKNGENWTGTFKLVNTTHKSVTWLDNLGNANSTVSFDNVTTYLYTSAGIGGSHGVGTMNIAAGGLKINGSYSSGNFVFPAKLTGTGTFTVGIAGNNNKNVQFTGDCSEFAGTIAWANDTVNTRVVIGDDTTAAFTAGTVVVNAGKTLGAATVNGTLEGAGAVAFTSIAPTTPTYGESWTGSIVLPVTNISAKTSLALPTLSTANGTIVVKGITRATNQDRLYLGTGASCTVAGTTQLDGELHVTDGSSNATYTWNKITGTGNALLTAEGGSAADITHAITTLDNYSGTITVGKNVTLTIGTINLASAPSAGDCLVKTAISGTGASISAANAKVAVNGEEITKPETLLLKSDGIYYGTATSTAYDGGDGSTFTIDASVAAVMTTYLPEGATLASTVEGKTFTYAQAYALGLVSVENDTLVVDDLTATIAIVDGKVVVSLGSTPVSVYTVTCNVYENTSLTDTWSETPAHTYVVGSETEAAGFTPASDAAGFYKVGVTIGNKQLVSEEVEEGTGA